MRSLFQIVVLAGSNGQFLQVVRIIFCAPDRFGVDAVTRQNYAQNFVSRTGSIEKMNISLFSMCVFVPEMSEYPIWRKNTVLFPLTCIFGANPWR
jgi:hypothetical protein